MVRIIDPDPRIERILRDIEAKVDHTIVGLDGQPLLEPIIEDRTITYAKDGESFSLNPNQFFVRVGRMSRDGMSAEAIHRELDLKNVSLPELERALAFCRGWLDREIAEGREPEESRQVVGYRVIDDDDGEG